MQSLMPFTLTHNPQFYGVGVFLPNILIIGLLLSNIRIIHITANMQWTIIYDGGGGRGGGGGWVGLSRVFRFFCF